MSNINRRDMIKGATAVMAIASVGLPIASEAAPDFEAVAAVKRWVVQYTVRLYQPTVLKTDYSLNERVMIKLLSSKNDRRKFAAQSLDEVDGKVLVRIPANAVPWRYIQNRADIPLKFRLKVRRSKLWQRPTTGRLFAVNTSKGMAIVPPHRMRSRENERCIAERVS